ILAATNQYYLMRNQYYEKTKNLDDKNYFRASELGFSDRRLVYSFFEKYLQKNELTPDQLRVFENGDYVHDRYQRNWDAMGCLIHMEKTVSSKEDEILKLHDWELRGR